MRIVVANLRVGNLADDVDVFGAGVAGLASVADLLLKRPYLPLKLD